MDTKSNNSVKFTSFNCKSVKRSIDNITNICMWSDLVALQETWLLPHDIPILGTICPDFEWTGKSAVDTSEGLLKGRPHGGVAILWRKGIFDSVSVVDCASPRLAAITATSKGRTILVFSIYMPTNCPDNLPIFTDVLSEISATIASSDVENVFMLGDFNAHPHSLFYKELMSFCSDQSWICADIEKLGVDSDTYTFISDVYGSRTWLDHLLVSVSAWHTVKNVSVSEDLYVSDHLPICFVCNLEVVRPKFKTRGNCRDSVLWGERTKSESQNYHNYCNSKLRDVHFPHEFESCGRGSCGLAEHRVVLDRLYDKIVGILCAAARQSKLTREGGPRRGRRVCGWNELVKDAHREARYSFQAWIHNNRPSSGPIYDEMYEKRKTFKARLKYCQNNAEQIIMDRLAEQRATKNFGKFWKSTSKLDAKAGLSVSVGGMAEPRNIANMFEEHFKVQSPLGPSSLVSDSEPSSRGGRPLILFSAKQVSKIINSMSRGKSPGHDGLSIEHLKHAGVHLPRVLSMFFTMCISHAYLPSDLMKTIVVPIVKNKTGDISDKCNYRPISLATIIAKVLDGMLDAYLNDYIHLQDAQFGFRPGLSTESAILGLKHTVQYYVDRKTPVYACFLDLSRAFDLVSYEVLWGKMRDRGIPAEICRIFQYWYGNQTNQVKWDGTLSEPYGLECGVRQGGLTSPRLFNLYIDDLIAKLSGMRVGCSVGGVRINNISYADDMVLLGPSAGAIGDLLKVCETYAAAHGLIYNVNKCECLVFEVGGKCRENGPDLFINGSKIKRVSTFKYLGHYLTDDLRDDADIERERRALAVRSNMLARRFARCTDLVKITLFKAYCQSMYTGNLWVSYTKRSLDVLRVQYNNAFRMLLRLPRYCSASEMFAQARTDGFNAILRKKTASLLRRVRDSCNSILRTVGESYSSPIMKLFVQRVMGTNTR